ncbi:MAG TPA: TadE/TadG family type IV pilus assembly protein [Sphingomicrobium sp.]|nr:TadE/TadG family type IV pilus assembly protein [Sphingomicrobium sp.]
MTRRMVRLFADEGGSSVIEMGLVAPFLAAMLIGMVDLSRAYSTKLSVEQAAQRTIEKIQVSSYDPTDNEAIRQEAADAAGVPVANVLVASWLQCNNSSTKQSFTSSCSDGEPYARYIGIGIRKSYTPLFPVKWDRTASGIWTVRGVAGIRVQ